MNSRRPTADTRTFIRVHDGIADHPKVEPLSDKAFRLLIETWAWCSRHHTDGRVPLATWNKRSSAKARAELMSSGLATMVGEFVEMHDYLEHQRSAEEIAEAIAAKQDGGVFGNHNRWHVAKGRVEPSCKYCSPKGSVTDRSTDRSGTSLTDRFGSTETETETEEEQTTSPPSAPAADAATDDRENVLTLVPAPTKARKSNTYPPEFEAFWAAYPKRNGLKTGKYPASQQWARATKLTTPAVLMAAVKTYAQQCGDLPKDAERWLKNRMWEDHATARAQAQEVTYDLLHTTADARRAAELIREPWADKPQHPDDTTPRAQFLKATRQAWIADHRDAIEAALTRRAG